MDAIEQRQSLGAVHSYTLDLHPFRAITNYGKELRRQNPYSLVPAINNLSL
jgi:hypothetical protein